MKSRTILCVLVTPLIFFLTGCAGGRYHKNTSGTAVFDWPLEGKMTAPYGSPDQGVSLKGILIEGAEGRAVRAVASGRVAFADPALRGYGQTVILEHGSGLSTVYAGMSETSVSAGQEVERGQRIGRVGRGGKGGTPQLYFEVRRAARTEDPLRSLR